MGFVIKDPSGEAVYSFNGPSDGLEEGEFLSLNNGCGNDQACETPQNLIAVMEGDHVLLTWEAVEDEGYGYLVFRDGQLCRLIPAGTGTSYVDDHASAGGHCYQVAVLCEGGESEVVSNESCAAAEPYFPPRNLDYDLNDKFQIVLSWEPPVQEGFAGYFLFRRQGDGEYKRVKILNPDYVTYVDKTTH